jgi:hypothetical protein
MRSSSIESMRFSSGMSKSSIIGFAEFVFGFVPLSPCGRGARGEGWDLHPIPNDSNPEVFVLE